MMFRYKLTIAYDGTAYSGWQVQPNGVTIQEMIQRNMEIILRNPVTIVGSGRTDAGVHALGQIAHFSFPENLNAHKFLHSLNGLLPLDIRVYSMELASENFHAQYSALGKIYHYFLHLDRVNSPFNRLYHWHLRERISVEILKEAAVHFLGTHDFTSFANEPDKGCAAIDPIRTLKRLDVMDQTGGLRLEFEGDGFLYKMVRNLVGMLVDVASGKKQLSEIPLVFEARDRKRAGRAAPPEGLFLVKVLY